MTMKKFISLLAAFLLLLCCGVSAFAHETPDLTRTGSLVFTMRHGGDTVTGGTLKMVRVAEISESDGNYGFSAIPELGVEMDADRLDDPKLAEELAALAAEKGLPVLEQPIAGGNVTFSDLKLGVYLVTQGDPMDGFAPISPFLISIPQYSGGVYRYDLTASPKVPLVPETTEPPETTVPPTFPPDLPQTGQLHWPVPVLAFGGLFLILVGIVLRHGKKEEYES